MQIVKQTANASTSRETSGFLPLPSSPPRAQIIDQDAIILAPPTPPLRASLLAIHKRKFTESLLQVDRDACHLDDHQQSKMRTAIRDHTAQSWRRMLMKHMPAASADRPRSGESNRLTRRLVELRLRNMPISILERIDRAYHRARVQEVAKMAPSEEQRTQILDLINTLPRWNSLSAYHDTIGLANAVEDEVARTKVIDALIDHAPSAHRTQAFEAVAASIALVQSARLQGRCFMKLLVALAPHRVDKLLFATFASLLRIEDPKLRGELFHEAVLNAAPLIDRNTHAHISELAERIPILEKREEVLRLLTLMQPKWTT